MAPITISRLIFLLSVKAIQVLVSPRVTVKTFILSSFVVTKDCRWCLRYHTLAYSRWHIIARLGRRCLTPLILFRREKSTAIRGLSSTPRHRQKSSMVDYSFRIHPLFCLALWIYAGDVW